MIKLILKKTFGVFLAAVYCRHSEPKPASLVACWCDFGRYFVVADVAKWRLAVWLERGDLLNPPHAHGLWEGYYTRQCIYFVLNSSRKKTGRYYYARAQRCRHLGRRRGAS